MSTGKLIIVSGFSGVGKGTAISGLMERNPGRYEFSISATTRSPRPGEEHGKQYYFVSHEEFENMIKEGKLLEYTKYGVNYYGTPVEPIDKMISEGKNIILDIEVEGKRNVTSMRDALSVFIVPPTSDALVERLIGRGTESREDALRRLTQAVEESSYAPEYDAVITNTDIEETVDSLEAFINKGFQPQEEKERNLILSAEVCEGIKRYINEGEF